MPLKNIAKMVHKANKEKTPAEEFLYMLNSATMELQREEDEYKGGVYRPSSLGGCLRMQYFQVEDYKRDTFTDTAEGVGILQSGTDRHERIQDTVQKMENLGMPVKWIDPEEWVKRRKPKGTQIVGREGNETRFKNTVLNLHFKCDGIIHFKNTYFILEIKTEASFKHRGRVAPVPKHTRQASAYSLGLGVDKIMFLYENRDVLGKRTFVFEVTNEMRGEVIEEIETIETYRTLKQIPPMTENKNDCTYCNFRKVCAQTGETEAIK